MMLKPYMNELLKKIPNRYMLVNVTAKRARDIAVELEEQGIEVTDKPVTMALEEIDNGKIIAKVYIPEQDLSLSECEQCSDESCQTNSQEEEKDEACGQAE